jgi:hypothetical protein
MPLGHYIECRPAHMKSKPRDLHVCIKHMGSSYAKALQPYGVGLLADPVHGSCLSFTLDGHLIGYGDGIKEL